MLRDVVELNHKKNHLYFDLHKLRYEPMKMFGTDVIFTPDRVDRKSIPKGIHVYEVQHDDDHQGIITLLGKNIHVNFWGTILSSKKIGLDPRGYRDVNEDVDIEFSNEMAISFDEYINHHPIKKKNEQER